MPLTRIKPQDGEATPTKPNSSRQIDDKLGLAKIPEKQADISDIISELEHAREPPGAKGRRPNGKNAGLRTLIDGVAKEVARDVLKKIHRDEKKLKSHRASKSRKGHSSKNKDGYSGAEDELDDEAKFSLDAPSSAEGIPQSSPTLPASRVRLNSHRRGRFSGVGRRQRLTYLRAFRKHWRDKMASAAQKKIDIPSSGTGKGT